MTRTKAVQPALFADDNSPTLAEDARKLWAAGGEGGTGRDCPDMVRRSCGSDVRAAAKDDAITDEKLAAVVASALFALKPYELRAVARVIADFTCPRW